MVEFTRIEETSDRVDYRVSKKERVRGNVFVLGHIKLEAPRELTRKIWINTFGVGIDDFTQEKRRMLSRCLKIHTNVIK